MRTVKSVRRLAAALLACLSVAGGAVADAAAPRGAAEPPRLHELLRGARTVVVGRVAEVREHDSGRVAVAEIAVARTLKGDAGATVSAVELRSLPSVPPVFASGDYVLAFLGPAARSSYLRTTLPEGDYMQAPGGREHVLSAATAAPVDEAAVLVERLVAASREPDPDPAKQRAAARALVFDEIAARHPAVVEDGVAALATVPDLEPLAGGERTRLAAALAREDLPLRVRERLCAQVASLGLEDMIGPLQALRGADPAVVAASWQALRRLGATPAAEQVAAELASADPARRAAAARELLARGDRETIERVGALAVDDPDAGVRQQVIDALAATGSPDALPALERAFAAPGWDGRQAAGRAIFRIGGRPAAETFARLSFVGPPEMQRYAVTLLRASGVAQDDPLLARIRTQHPDAEVRETAAHGLPLHEH